jgi:hypothetical protein
MKIWLLALAAVAVFSPVTGASARTDGFTRSIVPGVGMGGVTLGESLTEVHRQLGAGLVFTGDGPGGYGEYWQWDAVRGLYLPVDALNVDYAYVDGKPGPLSFLATPGGWTISGTNIVPRAHGDLTALRRFYGKRLLGPYIGSPPTGRDGSAGVYYELPGRYLGRAVHTVFETTTYRPLADEILSVVVSFCVATPLFRDAQDYPCHRASSVGSSS